MADPSALVELLQEFFTTPHNTRKAELEQLLQKYKEHEHSLIHAQQLLSESSNQYVQWFATSMLEHFVKHRWYSLPLEDKVKVLEFLLEFLRVKQTELEPFVSNSVAKVVVQIGKLGWPHDHPEFFIQIFALAKEKETSILGVYLLVLAIEEFTSSREDVPSVRKRELKERIIQMLPDIMNFFRTVLQQTITNSTGDHDSNILLKQSQWIMSALLHLFSWIPLDQKLTVSLIEVLFTFFGAEGDLGLLAFSCMNELLRRNFVPMEYKQFLVQLFEQVFSWLGAFLREPDAMDRVSPELVAKFTEFTLLFVSSHLHRVQEDSRFPLGDFFSLLLEFTFQQREVVGFLSCLEIWNVLVDHVDMHTEMGGSVSTAESTASHYRPVLIALFQAIVQKLQFRRNKEWLEDLVDIPSSSSSKSTHHRGDNIYHSEFDNLMDKCLVIVAQLVVLYPNDTVEPLCTIFSETAMQLVEMLQKGIPIDNILLNDTITTLRLSACSINHFLKYYEESTDTAAVVFGRIIAVGEFISESSMKGTTLHREILRTLRVWMPWIGKYKHQEDNTLSPGIRCSRLAINAIEQRGDMNEIQLTGAKLLQSITTTARIEDLLSSSILGIEALINVAHQSGEINEELQMIVYGAVSNGIVIIHRGVRLSPEQWNERAIIHKKFLTPLVTPFLTLAEIDDESALLREEVTNGVTRVLKTLGYIFAAVHDAGTAHAHSIVYHSSTEALSMAVQVLPHYKIHTPTLICLLDFFKVAIETLHAQLGAEFIQIVISSVMHIFSGMSMGDLMLNKSGTETNGTTILVKFLELLVLVVEDSSPTSRNFLPDILNLCLHQLYPVLISIGDDAIEVRNRFFNLLHSIGANQWGVLSTRHDDMHAVLVALVSALRLSDINLVRQVLLTLESINEKHRLYSREIFITQFRFNLLNCLFFMLLSKTHDLLRDEIISTLYDIASVDFDSYYGKLVPTFLKEHEGLSPEQKEHLFNILTTSGARDMPSFRACLNEFTNDFGCF